MAGIIEKYANTPIKIRMENEISDGKVVWGDGISALAIEMGFSQTDAGIFGAIQNGKIFLVSPIDIHLSLPATIECSDKTYDVKGIKPYRNMKGVMLGYRIAVAGA